MTRPALAGALLVTGLALTAGCTADRDTTADRGTGFRDRAVPAGTFQLVAFDSCRDALGKLREAARRYVGPYGFGHPGGTALDGELRADNAGGMPAAAPEAALPDAARRAADPAAPGEDYSGTNTHEQGVDEPDLVKTDGRRIITVGRGVLRVVDAQSKQVTGRLDLRPDGSDLPWSTVDLLLHGDHVLVLVDGGYRPFPAVDFGADGRRPGGERPAGGPAADPERIVGPRLLLVDLADGAPMLASSYTVDGQLVDARQTGAVARVVVRSGPRLVFPDPRGRTDAERTEANRAIVERAGAEDWLPRYEVTDGTRTSRGRVDCAAVSRPASYTGTSMTTVLSFDLGRSTLDDGRPVTVVADGQTVYSNGTSLYLANDQRWRAVPPVPEAGRAPVVEPRTELYKFDLSGADRPRYVAAGAVPGWLVNQYALSEWSGHLRVATTSGQERGRNPRSESAVYVLRHSGRRLVETGRVTGLGKGERIYAVRFVGPVGYVVTFRQTDPLYTVDLHDPAAPAVRGELKITGYSAYLHPAGADRLIGIGQEATEQGRVQGTQVSLFDVADLAQPRRIARYHIPYGGSEAEFDPHAFLYWPATGLLVVPLSRYDQAVGGQAMVLRVGDGGLTRLGTVEHPGDSAPSREHPGQIRRSLVIGDVLWTVSNAGLKASDATTLRTLAWIEL